MLQGQGSPRALHLITLMEGTRNGCDGSPHCMMPSLTGLTARVAPLPTMQLVVGWKSQGPVPFLDLRF